MAESDRDGATGGKGSELVTRPLADVSGFKCFGQTDKWVSLGAPASLKRGLRKKPRTATHLQKQLVGTVVISVGTKFTATPVSPGRDSSSRSNLDIEGGFELCFELIN